ncbi:hypothetical protein PybrP1_005578 [[Pythium] brassicae (nom. inval.)]|nr:hypothetical protein PybrP1_005578 [[Pythium] brassicae (nom. inval.)]
MVNIAEISQLPGMSAMAAPLAALTNISTGDGGPPTNANSPSPKPVPRHPTLNHPNSRRWNLIKKDVLPNPLLMQISERLLYTWLMNQEKLSSLFTTMSEISAKKLCKEMEFRHLKGGEVVVNQGEKGNTCFILVSGLVSVYVRSPEDQKKYQRHLRASMDPASSSRRLSADVVPVNYGTKVVSLTPGATFGELCLIEPDSKRSATVIVDPQAQIANFIVLTAASYLRMTRSQTIEGTITDHMAFLQHALIFRKWSKMQLMHLVNSMKLLTVPAGQYICHKGAEADSFFMILRGEAQESVKLILNESSEMSMGENRGVQHSITVELTFLGKFDVAGEYLAAEKKVLQCPTDIRAMTDVDCLVLTKHGRRALKRIRAIAETREAWRETRINQALLYPHLRVPITRKLMRLSGNCCVICGRSTHVAGDELCMDLAIYYMRDEKLKRKERKQVERSMSRHRISVAPGSLSPAKPGTGDGPAETRRSFNRSALPRLSEDDALDALRAARGGSRQARLGSQLVSKHWKEAERAGLHSPVRPATTPLVHSSRMVRTTSITRTHHVSQHRLQKAPKMPIEEQVRRIRESWPYEWHEGPGGSDASALRLPEKERETLVTKRCTTFARTPSSSQDDGPPLAQPRTCSPSRAFFSPKGSVTAR